MYYCAHSQPLPKKFQLPGTFSSPPPPPTKISQPPKNMLTINPPAPPHFTYNLQGLRFPLARGESNPTRAS